MGFVAVVTLNVGVADFLGRSWGNTTRLTPCPLCVRVDVVSNTAVGSLQAVCHLRNCHPPPPVVHPYRRVTVS